jgi:hypothetical protein
MEFQRTSFYVPAIGYMTEDRIKEIFWSANIGKVNRVDYFENTNGVWCAFVHFDFWIEGNDTYYVWEQVNRYGSYKLWFNKNEFLILRKMTCSKIPETSMNIHQIALKISELENRISQQNEIIVQLKNSNYSNSNSVDVTVSVKTDESIDELNNGMILNCIDSDSDKSYDNGYDYNYSYDYESRMKKISESMVDSLVGPRWTDEDYLDSKNNIFVIADGDSDSKTSFDSNNSKRMRFTAEFCDNE